MRGMETLSAHAIARWRLLLVGCLGVVLLSALSWFKIPRLADPRVEASAVIVQLVVPGASSAIVESRVVKVIEPSLRELDGLKVVDSRASPGYAVIFLVFEDGSPMDVVLERVRGRLAAKRAELPPELREEVTRPSTANVASMVVAVVGNRSDVVLGSAARSVRDELSSLPSVAGVTLRGAAERAVRVRVDPALLATHGLSAERVAERLRAANVRSASGELRIGKSGSFLELDGAVESVEALRELPVLPGVRLADVAEVRDTTKPMSERFAYDGVSAVGLEVRFRQDDNAVAAGEAVRARLHAIEGRLPAATSIRIAHDQPAEITSRITTLLTSFGEGIVLVLVIITLGLGLRSAVVVAGVLPLAIGSAIVALFVSGMALDRISIAGLIVALGLLVDDAVVVAESIDVMREKGLERVRAAVLGTARVFWANNATTAVACASFVPLFFMGGSVGQFIRPLPLAVVFALVASLFAAQLFTPWASLIGGKKRVVVHAERPNDDAAATPEREPKLAIRLFKRAYARCIPVAVGRPWTVIAAFTVLLVGSLALLPRVGVEFFPTADRAIFFVRIDAPRGSHLDATREKVSAALAIIQHDPDVLDSSAVVGGGYPSVHSSRAMLEPSPDVADVLVHARSSREVPALVSRLRVELAKLPAVRVNVSELYDGPPVPHPIVLRLSGDSYDELAALAEQVEHELASIPGTVNVNDSMHDMIPVTRVTVDRVRAAQLGITPASIASALRALHGSDAVTALDGAGERVDVLIEDVAPGEAIQHVEQTIVSGAAGVSVPLSTVAKILLASDAAELRHHDGLRTVEVHADLERGVVPSLVIGALEPRLAAMRWPHGCSYGYGGAREEAERGFRYLGIAALGALLLIGILLVWIFDSLLLSVAVLCVVPYVMIGVVAGLLVGHIPFGFMSFLGGIALIGVFVNHKIYFVDRMKELRRRGYGLEAAITQAGNDRIRPVVLTAFTAILGLLPLMLGGGPVWASFGWVNVFGLLVSIPLSLVFLPAVIVGLSRIFERTRSASPHAALAADVTLAMPNRPPVRAALDLEQAGAVAAHLKAEKRRERSEPC